MQVDNLILEKELGEGAFGKVFLTKIEGDNDIYATKIYDRDIIEKTPDLERYMKSEISILNRLNHPNIVKFRDAKKTKKHYYLVMEYCNGGELGKALEKYQKKFGKPFSEEIVQYLMRQIMSAFNYLHSKSIMHRDIKLENILIKYNNEADKENLNLLKAQVKIIDFGFACILNSPNVLKESIVGNPMNMDPLILKKLNSNGRIRRLGYDIKVDIWSLGSICYEMLIGRSAFDSEDMDELVDKIEKGLYNVPTNLSKEVVSFINGMLQYDPKRRLTCAQLVNHPFLTTNINYLHKIDLNQVSNKIKQNQLQINTKKNNTIWAIFNKDDENKLMQIGQLPVIPEEKSNGPVQNQNSFNQPQDNVVRSNSLPEKNPMQGFNMSNNFPFQNINNFNYSHNFNNNFGQMNNNQNFGAFLPPRNENPIYINQKFANESNYVCSQGIYDFKLK